MATHFLPGKWFTGNMFNMALNISMSLGFALFALNGLILPLIYNSDNTQNLGWACLVGVGISFFALICGYFAGLLQYKQELIVGKDNLKEEEKFHLGDMKKLSYGFWLAILALLFSFFGE